jgi:hypothetical protein
VVPTQDNAPLLHSLDFSLHLDSQPKETARLKHCSLHPHCNNRDSTVSCFLATADGGEFSRHDAIISDAGFCGCGCRGRGSNAAPSPTTPSWLDMQSEKTRIRVVKFQGGDPP